MKVTSLIPSPGPLTPFEYLPVRSVGNGPGCYVLTNAGGDILYIGQATCISSRLLQHLDAGRNREMTSLGKASLVSILTLKEVIQLNAYERGWINQYELTDGCLPPLNKVHDHL
ncbi:GIY-YIG nuclease family protein [Acidobacterium sp. S8]|uniref:GIY-YIG nuclease family protein n=1 Tax=Acidobacterium sp. S8 TaxID=1641854 RepID=UPI00131C4C8B